MEEIAQYDYKQWATLSEGQIRLLKLHPGSGNTSLQANLLVRSLDKTSTSPKQKPAPEAEPFKALSYTWGPAALPGNELYFYILTADEDQESRSFRIEIKPNLESALRQLRSPTQDHYFWIDALCIDQKNNEEKSSQIPRMSDIYNRAEEVCIWLGPEEGKSAIAMDFVKRHLNLDNVDELVRNPDLDEQWHALTTLMRRPWFSRRWIVQELARARNPVLYCGDASIPWQDFADIVSLVSRKEAAMREIFRQSPRFHHKHDHVGDLRQLAAVQLIYTSDNLFRKSDDGQILEHLMSLEGLMCSLTVFQASDPRDVLYAILWLAHDAKPATKKVKALDRHISSIRSKSQSSPPPTPDFDFAVHDFDRYDGLFTPLLSPSLANVEWDYFHQGMVTEPEAIAGAEEVSTNLPSNSRKRGLSINAGRGVVIKRRNSSAKNHSPSSSLHILDTRATQNNGALPKPYLTVPKAGSFEVKSPADHLPDSIVVSNLDVLVNQQAETKLKSYKAATAAKGWLTAIRERQIIVDYDKSVFDICKEFLQFTIQRSKSLDMICRPWAPNELPGKGNLPSWIPKLTKEAFGRDNTGGYRRVNADPLVGKPGLTVKVYNAAKGTRAEVQWKSDEGCKRSMFVNGFILDFVKKEFPIALDGIVPIQWREAEAVDWTNLEEPPPQRFWRTLVGNRDEHGQRPPPYWRSFCRAAFASVAAGGGLNTKAKTDEQTCPFGQREVLERIQSVIWNRKLMELSRMNGALGLGPAEAKKGDLIVILFGCSVPVLLRKMVDGKNLKCKGYDPKSNTFWFKDRKEGKEQYRFIGECFVDGMMDGEAFRTSDEFSHVKKEIMFELR